jgi:glutamate synthase (NADPH/NADH) large chain
MSGGVAYVLDVDGGFAGRCNMELIELEVPAPDDLEEVRELLAEHVERTGSPVAANLLESWDDSAARFVKVMPRDYKRALAELAEAEAAAADELGAPA